MRHSELRNVLEGVPGMDGHGAEIENGDPVRRGDFSGLLEEITHLNYDPRERKRM